MRDTLAPAQVWELGLSWSMYSTPLIPAQKTIRGRFGKASCSSRLLDGHANLQTWDLLVILCISRAILYRK